MGGGQVSTHFRFATADSVADDERRLGGRISQGASAPKPATETAPRTPDVELQPENAVNCGLRARCAVRPATCELRGTACDLHAARCDLRPATLPEAELENAGNELPRQAAKRRGCLRLGPLGREHLRVHLAAMSGASFFPDPFFLQ